MRTVSLGQRQIDLVQGDITSQSTNAIVTAANAALRGGGGVDGAIHRAAGPELLSACRVIGSCETGSAVMTDSFGLRAGGVAHVIHAVGPIWGGGDRGEDHALRGAYRRSLKLAEEAMLESVAFPSISTGVYGFPVDRAATIAVGTARDFLTNDARAIVRVVFVLFDSETYRYFDRALGTS